MVTRPTSRITTRWSRPPGRTTQRVLRAGDGVSAAFGLLPAGPSDRPQLSSVTRRFLRPGQSGWPVDPRRCGEGVWRAGSPQFISSRTVNAGQRLPVNDIIEKFYI